MLTYADLYPDEVAGMVVIDTTAPKDKPTTSDRAATPTPTTSSTGSPRSCRPHRSWGQSRLKPCPKLPSPPRSSAEARSSLKTGDSLRAFIGEFLAANASNGRSRRLTDFADKPLVILTAGVGSDADFVATHERLASLSTNGVHRVIDGASHETLLADAKDSEATTQAVLDVLRLMVRGGGPLPR